VVPPGRRRADRQLSRQGLEQPPLVVPVADEYPGIRRRVRAQDEGLLRPVRPPHGGQRAEPAEAAADRPERRHRAAAPALCVIEEPLERGAIEMRLIGHGASCNVAWVADIDARDTGRW